MQNKLFDVNNKNILIVGASSGIGKHFATCLARAGANVLVAARRQEQLQRLAKTLVEEGNNAKTYTVDVTNEDSITDLMNKVEQEGKHIDVFLNTAGINLREDFMHYSSQTWRKVVQVNLDGTWLASHAVAKHMIKNNIAGSIIHISSAVSLRTTTGSTHPYMASKAGVAHLTRSLALELAPYNIRVNAIAPGWFETELNTDLLNSPKGEPIKKSVPLQRTGDLSELEGVLFLLASDASSYITGSELRVDGGYATNHLV